MRKSKGIRILTLIAITITLLSGCVIENTDKDYIKVSGIAENTKDGYYLGDYVLGYLEIKKYEGDYKRGEYENKMLEVVGREKEVEMPCEDSSGDLIQCREGAYKVIYDIQSIMVTADNLAIDEESKLMNENKCLEQDGSWAQHEDLYEDGGFDVYFACTCPKVEPDETMVIFKDSPDTCK